MPMPFGTPMVNWNIFRLIGDYLHLGGMLFGIFVVFGTKSLEGFSRKTQILYEVVYVARYLDIFVEHQSTYLFFFKTTYITLTALMILSFTWFPHTYNANADSCNLLAILIPALVVAYLTSHGTGSLEEMWTLSEFVEPFALVPQYIVCYRWSTLRPAAVVYVLALGGYRLFYVCNWIYKRYMWHSAYVDYVSWCGGLLECVIFIDFVLRISKRQEVLGALGASPVGRALLSADDGAGRLAEKIELKALGRRIPFGLSGSGPAGAEQESRQWDTSDRVREEEGSRLLSYSAGDAEACY
mmetsp:Transcript_24053/g.67552  ORF Transcript_24053/g.67552 Transcript_24053/m.67552 type:complete len:298 (+) Transcript_24053:74-967(+)